MTTHPSDGYSLTLRVRLKNIPGMLGRVTSAIGAAGGDIGAIDIVDAGRNQMVRDITIAAASVAHGKTIIDAVGAVPDAAVINVSDRVFLLHLGGKIEVRGKQPIKTRADLSMAYTPGVARVCEAIRDDPEKVFNLTMKRNCVAVVTDGTAVLGLGDIGPRAALPVMEGKAMLFKEFAGLDAFPICLDTKDPDEIVATVKAISPGFGGINLEDISAPRCFRIEERLKRELSIPVFHDDQHGTAVVVLAAVLNALRLTGRQIGKIKIAIVGAGAAGTACARILTLAGARNIVMCDIAGAIYRGRDRNPEPSQVWLEENTNPENVRGSLADVLTGADLFIGVSAGGVLKPEWLSRMNPGPIIFALANPTPEIVPEEAEPYASVVATGRSDYPNQINNVLCFPGIFRGAIDSRATDINEEMKVAAARAIAAAIPESELHPDYIIPSVFNRKVTPAVAAAVAEAARATGVARREAPAEIGEE
ncbi:MAG: NAD-dependent malic enzyme [Acidobacteriota bacterium]|nr:NAD-dependent malic enzyme [Acidobacteriota bacterium]